MFQTKMFKGFEPTWAQFFAGARVAGIKGFAQAVRAQGVKRAMLRTAADAYWA